MALANKSQKNEGQFSSRYIAQNQSNRAGSAQFLDQRLEAMQQRKIQEMATLSPRMQYVAQLKAALDNHTAVQLVQQKANQTGLSDQLKSGIESLSGINMDHVKVHYNSSQPAQLHALAYAQGSDIYVAPGQEKHVPHEAWHVVQQMQGRVQATRQAKGVSMNDDPALEREADLMGEKAAIHKNPALQQQVATHQGAFTALSVSKETRTSGVVQRLPTLVNAALYDAGTPNYIGGVFASTAADVLTTHANHNNASAPANPVNCNHIRSSRWVAANYRDGINRALTLAGAAPILNAVQLIAANNAIVGPALAAIQNATQNAALLPGTTAMLIAAAASNEAVAQGAAPIIAFSFYTAVLGAVPTYGVTPTRILIQGGISAGNAANQLTRVHIIHHGLGAGTNNNGNNIFWGNPGFNNPQILVEETRMLNFLNNAPQIFIGAVTLARDYFGVGGGGGLGNNPVAAHLGDWYTPTASTIPAKIGPLIIAGPLCATLDAAFGAALQPYQQIDTTTRLPRTGAYGMTVDYNQHHTNAMPIALNNARVAEYTIRINPRWEGEDDALVQAIFGQVVNEAQGSISSQVTVTQQQQSMIWHAASPLPAPVNSAIAIDNIAATGWNVVNHNNIVQDVNTPRLRLKIVYENANGNLITSPLHLHFW